MQLVDRPGIDPGHCIVNLSSEDPGGFVDTGLNPPVFQPRVYVSRQAVIDMGRLFGFPTPDENASLQAEVAELRSEVERLKEENTNLERDVLSAEWTLERQFASKIQNKPGRPRKVTA